MLKNFKIASFQFHSTAEQTLHLPAYKGSTIMGGFGHAFRRVVCVTRQKDCSQCLLRGKCVYSYVFETPPPQQDDGFLRRAVAVPHPFVIRPPSEQKEIFQPGESFLFGLTLIGRAIDYLPYFIYSFEQLGKIGLGKGKAKFQLSLVRDSRGKTIYTAEDRVLLNDFETLWFRDFVAAASKWPSDRLLTLRFLTPTRIKFGRKLTDKLEFHSFMRNLLRRISLLSYYHCGERFQLDFKTVIQQAQQVQVKASDLRWFDWTRYSSRQNSRMKLGGVLGEICFEGDWQSFLSFILLGEVVHVGKGTSFGLGQYMVVRPK